VREEEGEGLRGGDGRGVRGVECGRGWCRGLVFLDDRRGNANTTSPSPSPCRYININVDFKYILHGILLVLQQVHDEVVAGPHGGQVHGALALRAVDDEGRDLCLDGSEGRLCFALRTSV
jgi:hypothetical protein